MCLIRIFVLIALLVGSAGIKADVTAVKGSAYGYSCVATVFGQSCTPSGPTPSVTLATNASNSPVSASSLSANATAGPATLFSSGRIDVSSQGTLGPSGFVTSSTNIQNVNASGNQPFTASNLASTCTASGSGVSGSTTITGGTLETDSGDDDPTNSIPDHPPVIIVLPSNPAPNTTYMGHVHAGNTTDNFRYVFNEQIVNSDGSLTVNAAHQYFLGPIVTGDLIIGQSVCGVTVTTGPAPVSVISRKIHGSSGTFDIDLLAASPRTECRSGGAGENYQVLVTFGRSVTVGGVSVQSSDNMATATQSVAGALVTVNLAEVANIQTAMITLTNVNDGITAGNVVIPFRVLIGDTTGNGSVTASDIGQVKGQSGQAVTAANFRTDVTANGGSITASDIGQVKSASGTQRP